MSAYFVTATGTDIGKTFVTAGLIRTLRSQGKNVSALKPVVSGFELAAAAASDPGVLLQALDQLITPQTLDRVSPWRFSAPLSPDMAAAKEGRDIDFDELVSFCRNAIATADGPLFIEGVGGIMVPLTAHETVLDWMAALKLPIVLVTGSYLGTISHTLTALDVIARRGLAISAVVLNDTGENQVPLPATAESIARFAHGIPLTIVPRAGNPLDDLAAFQAVAEIIACG